MTLAEGSFSCAECGFDYAEADPLRAGAEIVSTADEIAAVLSDPPPNLRVRPQPDTWSILEYACHVRDVLLVQRERVLLALREECPRLAQMGRDERVEHDGYSDQDPSDVARQLKDAAKLFANVLTRLTPEQWGRTLFYNFPEPAERSLRWAAVHTLHELRHHALDIRRHRAQDSQA